MEEALPFLPFPLKWISAEHKKELECQKYSWDKGVVLHVGPKRIMIFISDCAVRTAINVGSFHFAFSSKVHKRFPIILLQPEESKLVNWEMQCGLTQSPFFAEK